MKSLSGLAGETLGWNAVGGFRMDYELRDGNGDLAGRLRFRSACGSLAFAESADGRWSFKRTGFLKPRITVRLPGRHEDLAVFCPSTWTGGGTLTMVEGKQFQIKTEFWKAGVEIRNTTGDPFMVYRFRSPLHSCADMEMLPLAEGLPELPWLAVFGWYLMVVMQMDSVALTTATFAAITA